MRSISKKTLGVALLLAALGTTSSAQAQTTVSVDQAPATVQPGETFEVVWTISTPNPVLLTTVVWGERSRAWTKLGSIRSGASGTFRTMLTAPATPGAMHWAVYVRADPVRGTTAERVIQVTNTPTPTPTAPAAPSNLVADASSQTSVDLQWTDNANSETGFVVQRSTAGAAYQTLAQLGANATTYTDATVVASTNYSYRVNARNNAGASGNSNVASVTTPAPTPVPTAPAAPSALAATVAGANQVDLSWTDNSNNETAFLIGRRTGTTGNYAQIGQVAGNVTTYSDTGVQPGNSYQYSVFATNAVGNSGGTNVATANVPAASGTVTATRTETPALAIPDNDPQGAASRLNVTGAGSIQDLRITVDVGHSWRGDLVLRLTSPAGTAITLFDVNDNDDGDDVQGTFPTTLVPNESLSTFNGEEVNGVWTLQVYDTQGQDTGDIRSWILEADVGTGTAPQFGLTQRVPVTGLTFPITGAAAPTSLQRVRAFPNLSFNSPIQLTNAGDGTDRVFVVEQRGVIRVFANNDAVGSAAVFLDIDNLVRSGGERGLLGLAFDPNFAQNQKFYVYYTDNGGDTVVARYRAVAGTNRADPNSGQVILQVSQPYGNHNGGMIAFGADDMLYIGMGDGGSGGDPQGHGQNRRTLLGSILRINPHNSATYTIPTDNPFVNTGGGVRGEIWAYGIRNPWRFSFDRTSGDLWVGDVGQNAVEEIDIIRRGGNYGWNVREGDRAYNGGAPASNFDEPAYAYDQALGRSVIGGYVYHGSRVPGLQGIYVYGDYTSGRIWSLKYRNGQVEFNREVTSVNQLCAFGEDESGELYAVSHGGNLYKFSPNGGSTTTFPDRLSATGLFQDVATLTTAPGVIEYDVNAALWSDGAKKRRWIALPGNSRITFSATGNWQYPVGTVLVKHFELEMQVGNPASARRLETRVMINEQAGWAGYTYRWNDQQTEALLIGSGQFETYQVQDPNAPGGVRNQQWYFPSRVDCMNCHTQAAGFVLGPRTGQLNGDFAYPRMIDNQLRSWNNIGLFTQNIGAAAQQIAFSDYTDANASLHNRARGYLEANCSMCHQPGGPTPHLIDLRGTTSNADMNAIDVRPNGSTLGIGNAFVIAAGDKARSILWERMGRRNFEGMPTIGSFMVDTYGRDVIGQWIDAGAQ
jgi:uncharacterized repeat protein (TIGR03806 family)